MSVSLLPSSVYTHLRGLLSSLVHRSLSVSDVRREVSSLLRVFGASARLFALQLVVAHLDTIFAQQHDQHAQANTQNAEQAWREQSARALERLLKEEVEELQRREPFKWSVRRPAQHRHAPAT